VNDHTGDDTGDDERELLRRTVEAILTDHCPPELVGASEGSWSGPLWKRLADAGLTALGVPESAGGSGGALTDAAAVVRAAASYAAPLPLAETLFPAAAICVRAGFDLPDGPLTAAAGPDLTYSRRDGGVRFEGTVPRVPYARVVDRIVLVAADGQGGEVAALVDRAAFILAESDNLAGEPRDRLTADGVTPGEVAEVAPGTVELVREQGALARSVQIAGALGEVLDLCVRYTGERVQFGRPIGKFQAVAHLVARLAAMVTSVEAAAHAAVLAQAAGAHGDPTAREAARLAVAAAKTQASATAGLGARIAHQVHGTIGFTQEYRLHHLTRRLWSWREEYGCDEHWSAVLGAHVINQGAEELWPTMTRV
jgi:acyl-CoA dehydrogenase